MIEDFGHVLRGTATGVVRPQTVAEVVEVVGAAISSGAAVTPRAFAHSAGGQALPADSAVVDLTAMTSVSLVDAANGTVRCEPGARLRDVVAATLTKGLLPRALTNLLDLSVGGLLSVGGIGPGSHRSGPVIANVASLEVVTGDGQLRLCSRAEARDLYEAVLGGLGQCGIIVSAELELRRVAPRVRTYYLLYDDAHQWIEDQRLLAGRAEVSAMEGFCSPNAQGYRGTSGERAPFAEWFFPLHVSVEFETTAPELPREIAPYRVVGFEDDEIRHFPARSDVRIDAIRRMGGWERPHPYISALISPIALAEILPTVLQLLPLTDGHRGTLFVNTNEVPPLMAVPDGDESVFFAVMYPQVLPEALPQTLEASQAAAEILTNAGGKRYVADWLGEPSEVDWQDQLGDAYERWVRAKRSFDPHHVFRSLLIPSLG